jgi:hypothetical protein
MLLDRKRLTSCIVIEDDEFESHSGLIKSPEDRRELEKHYPGLVAACDRAVVEQKRERLQQELAARSARQGNSLRI